MAGISDRDRTISWSGGVAMIRKLAPFVAMDQPREYAPYAMSMVFTPVEGHFRVKGERDVVKYTAPRATLTLTATDPLEHLASQRGGRGILIHSTSEEYIDSICALRRKGDFESGFIHRSGDAAAWAIMSRWRSVLLCDDDPAGLELDTLMVLLQRRIVSLVGRMDRPERAGELSGTRTRRVIEYIDEHLGENIPLDMLANVAALSPFHFLRSFKRTTGMAPHQYVAARKLEITRIAIEQGMPPLEAARMLGFRHARNFEMKYERHHGFPSRETPGSGMPVSLAGFAPASLPTLRAHFNPWRLQQEARGMVLSNAG